MISLKGRLSYSLLLAIIALFVSVQSSYANPSSMAFSELKGTAENYIKAGDFSSGIPYFQEMIKRNGGKDKKALENLVYSIGLGHM